MKFTDAEKRLALITVFGGAGGFIVGHIILVATRALWGVVIDGVSWSSVLANISDTIPSPNVIVSVLGVITGSIVAILYFLHTRKIRMDVERILKETPEETLRRRVSESIKRIQNEILED